MRTPKDYPYQKQIDEAHSTINADQSECDKQLLTLSSGFLAVSLAFIKDIVKLSVADGLWELYAAWIIFSLCILLVLFSFQFSITGHFKAKRYWENLSANPDLNYPHGHAVSIKWVNRVSAGLFGLGVSFLVLFIICNVRKEAAMSPIMAQDGSNMRTPQQRDLAQKGSNMKVPSTPPVQPQTHTSTSSSSTATAPSQPVKK